MNERDIYIRELIQAGKLKPKPGHMWCRKIYENKKINIAGLGQVTGTVSPSGLVVVGAKDTQDEAVLSRLVVVMALGDEPPAWRFRFFDRERDFKTSLAEQGVAVGTALMIRAVAGVAQDSTDAFIEVRYDEIVAIGQTEGEHDMLPAPGWIALDMTTDEGDGRIGSIFVRPDAIDAVRDGQLHWGQVLALPVGYDGTLIEGDHVAVDRFQFTEYMQVGKTRYVPQDEVLVEMAHD